MKSKSAYNKMMLGGLTLKEAFALARKINKGREIIRVLIQDKSGEYVCNDLWLHRGVFYFDPMFELSTDDCTRTEVKASSKVKIIGGSVFVEDGEHRFTLTFFYEPEAINIPKEMGWGLP